GRRCRAPCPVACKIAAAREYSSFKMAAIITDRRVKGAPILIRRRTAEGFLRLVASAFRTYLLRCFVPFLTPCGPGSAVAAPATHAPDDPVRDAATRAIKRLDLQVSLPH